jgi:hypothetical protein
VPIDTICPVCKRFDEDGGHCFLKCKAVRKCWQELNLENERCELLQMQSARDMVDRVLQMPEDKCNLILILLWRWWTACNKVNARENPEPISVVTRAVCYLANAVQNGSRKSKRTDQTEGRLPGCLLLMVC